MRTDIDKNTTEDYWGAVSEGFPEELKYLILAAVHGNSKARKYTVKAALCYLLEHSDDCNSYINQTTGLDYLHIADDTIESILYPVEFNENHWQENYQAITKILERMDSLLERVGPADYKTGHRMATDRQKKFRPVELYQKLLVYQCTLYNYREDWDKLAGKLKELKDATIRNVSYLMDYEDEALSFASEDDYAIEWHYPGSDCWEPVNWIMKEYIANDTALEMLTRTYGEYTAYLVEHIENAAIRHMYVRAETYFGNLCQEVLDRIQDEVEESDETVSPDLIEKKAEFEKMLAQRLRRQAVYREKYGAAQPDGNRNEPEELYRFSVIDDENLPFH